MQLRNRRRRTPPLSQAIHDDVPRRPRVNGIDRAFEILDFLLAHGQPARCAEIARGTGMPVSTSYQIVERLLGHQVLTGDVDGMIALGPRLAQYGRGYRQTTPLLKVASDEMARLAQEVGESVQICGRADNEMVVLAMESGPGLFAVTSQVGTHVPINWTASGLLLTGHMDEAERLELYREASVPSPTGEAETDPHRLSRASARAFAERLAVQVNGADFGVACVAAPIIDDRGQCVATISIVVPGIKARLPELKRAVRQAARTIEARIGWDSLPLEPGEVVA